jgi:hypothetical protein
MKKVIEAVGEYTWNIPCKDAEHAGFEITINSGEPNKERENPQEVWDTDGYSGLKDGFVRFRGYDKETGWESTWECSLESFIKIFATRCVGGITKINGEEAKII